MLSRLVDVPTDLRRGREVIVPVVRVHTPMPSRLGSSVVVQASSCESPKTNSLEGSAANIVRGTASPCRSPPMLAAMSMSNNSKWPGAGRGHSDTGQPGTGRTPASLALRCSARGGACGAVLVLSLTSCPCFDTLTARLSCRSACMAILSGETCVPPESRCWTRSPASMVEACCEISSLNEHIGASTGFQRAM